MITIYHKPHSARRSEASFVQLLRGQFPEAIYRAENFPLPAESLRNPVHTAQLLAALETDALLPARQRTQCIELLRICPPELAVALNPNRISFDVVRRPLPGPTSTRQPRGRRRHAIVASRSAPCIGLKCCAACATLITPLAPSPFLVIGRWPRSRAHARSVVVQTRETARPRRV